MSLSSTPYRGSELSSGKEPLKGSCLEDPQKKTHLFLDTIEAISSMVDELYGLPSTPPSLYIDLEGVKLSRHGTISILQIHVRTTAQNYLVDVKVLGRAAFLTPGSTTPNTLKSILESPSIPKVFFDVRRDSDALYGHYGIELQGIQDLQLMEFAARPHRGRFLSSLKRCIEMDIQMTSDERNNWIKTKDEGKNLFSPEKGGSYEVFNRRPLSEKIVIYCVQDVHYLPRLWDLYNGKLTATWKDKVRDETKDRVAQSQTSNFNAEGGGMTLPPVGWGWR
ncbi:hypothetical protein EKO27_g8046 [Xylaria grammica]|uniref:3'-5' exonuclease domain-containing protein n=1 Tax=Xylaria grammica TaxID=363999 RepID=A0A439CY65_9PEZI|nr:hypothetical protein EKO27_g8046 [Xylaria grammica]